MSFAGSALPAPPEFSTITRFSLVSGTPSPLTSTSHELSFTPPSFDMLASMIHLLGVLATGSKRILRNTGWVLSLSRRYRKRDSPPANQPVTPIVKSRGLLSTVSRIAPIAKSATKTMVIAPETLHLGLTKVSGKGLSQAVLRLETAPSNDVY